MSDKNHVFIQIYTMISSNYFVFGCPQGYDILAAIVIACDFVSRKKKKKKRLCLYPYIFFSVVQLMFCLMGIC